MAIPTTDEMDKTTPEERNKLVGQCGTCGDWVHFTRGVDKEQCPKDGGNLMVGSIISQRTFNPAWAKRKVKGKR